MIMSSIDNNRHITGVVKCLYVEFLREMRYNFSRVKAWLQKETVMRVPVRLDRLSVMSVLVLAGFLVVCVGVDFCHDHEAGEESHDLCPACQWNNLHQEDHSSADEIFDILGSSITLIDTRIVSQVLIIPSDDNGKTISTRGPPSSI